MASFERALSSSTKRQRLDDTDEMKDDNGCCLSLLVLCLVLMNKDRNILIECRYSWISKDVEGWEVLRDGTIYDGDNTLILGRHFDTIQQAGGSTLLCLASLDTIFSSNKDEQCDFTKYMKLRTHAQLAARLISNKLSDNFYGAYNFGGVDGLYYLIFWYPLFDVVSNRNVNLTSSFSLEQRRKD